MALRRPCAIDETCKADPEGDRLQLSTESAGHFMTVMAGDLPGYEEASRALYACETGRLQDRVQNCLEDVRTHLISLVHPPDALRNRTLRHHPDAGVADLQRQGVGRHLGASEGAFASPVERPASPTSLTCATFNA